MGPYKEIDADIEELSATDEWQMIDSDLEYLRECEEEKERIRKCL